MTFDEWLNSIECSYPTEMDAVNDADELVHCAKQPDGSWVVTKN